jgi:hypothetical protein
LIHPEHAPNKPLPVVGANTPQSNGKVLSFLRACGTVLNEQYCDGSVLMDARLGQNQLPHLKRLRPQAIEILQT